MQLQSCGQRHQTMWLCLLALCSECEFGAHPSFRQSGSLRTNGHWRHRAGLFDNAADRVYLELGAGKGYLSLMVARATAAARFILADVRTFQLKADRLLRRMRDSGDKPLELLRCLANLKDFCVPGAVRELECGATAATGEAARTAMASARPAAAVTHAFTKEDDANNDRAAQSGEAAASSAGALQQRTAREYVGLGKHLCGAATDFALRGLLHREFRASGAAVRDGFDVGNASPIGNTARQRSDSPQARSKSAQPAPALAGLCIAPCCHHACSWQAYVGKDVIRELGFSAREFEMLSWMAGAQTTGVGCCCVAGSTCFRIVFCRSRIEVLSCLTCLLLIYIGC